MSLLMLLGGIAAVLFAFGRFDFLGWQRDGTPADMNTWEQRQPASWSGPGCPAISYLSLSVSCLCCG
jgi:hypothetical protein